jgi:hypothetical protein
MPIPTYVSTSAAGSTNKFIPPAATPVDVSGLANGLMQFAQGKGIQREKALKLLEAQEAKRADLWINKTVVEADRAFTKYTTEASLNPSTTAADDWDAFYTEWADGASKFAPSPEALEKLNIRLGALGNDYYGKALNNISTAHAIGTVNDIDTMIGSARDGMAMTMDYESLQGTQQYMMAAIDNSRGLIDDCIIDQQLQRVKNLSLEAVRLWAPENPELARQVLADIKDLPGDVRRNELDNIDKIEKQGKEIDRVGAHNALTSMLSAVGEQGAPIDYSVIEQAVALSAPNEQKSKREELTTQAELAKQGHSFTQAIRGESAQRAMELAEELKPEGYGLRNDGKTVKGTGWLGKLTVKGGGIATEYTVGVNIDGEEIDIPTLVPTLTKAQVKLLTDDIIPNQKPIPDDIMQKAVDHAKKQVAEGKSVFANDGATKFHDMKWKLYEQAKIMASQHANMVEERPFDVASQSPAIKPLQDALDALPDDSPDKPAAFQEVLRATIAIELGGKDEKGNQIGLGLNDYEVQVASPETLTAITERLNSGSTQQIIDGVNEYKVLYGPFMPDLLRNLQGMPSDAGLSPILSLVLPKIGSLPDYGTPAAVHTLIDTMRMSDKDLQSLGVETKDINDIADTLAKPGKTLVSAIFDAMINTGNPNAIKDGSSIIGSIARYQAFKASRGEKDVDKNLTELLGDQFYGKTNGKSFVLPSNTTIKGSRPTTQQVEKLTYMLDSALDIPNFNEKQMDRFAQGYTQEAVHPLWKSGLFKLAQYMTTPEGGAINGYYEPHSIASVKDSIRNNFYWAHKEGTNEFVLMGTTGDLQARPIIKEVIKVKGQEDKLVPFTVSVDEAYSAWQQQQDTRIEAVNRIPGNPFRGGKYGPN